MLRPPEGYAAIPGSKHGGYRKPKPGGGYDYWYPYASAAGSAAHRAKYMVEDLLSDKSKADEQREVAQGSQAAYDAMRASPVDLQALRGYQQGTVAHLEGMRDQLGKSLKAVEKQRLDAINNVICVANEVHALHSQVDAEWDKIVEAAWDASGDEAEEAEKAPGVSTELADETSDIDDTDFDVDSYEEYENELMTVPLGSASAALRPLQERVRGSCARIKAAMAERDKVLAETLAPLESLVNQIEDFCDHAAETYESLWDEAGEAYESERQEIIDENERLDEQDDDWDGEDEFGGDDLDEDDAVERKSVPPEWKDKRGDVSGPSFRMYGQVDMSDIRDAASELNEFIGVLKKAPVPPVPMAKGVWRVRPIDRLRGMLPALRRMAV